MNTAIPDPASPVVATDPSLVEAYRRAVWTVELPSGSSEVRLDGALPELQLRPGGIVTAYNPASIPRDEETNRAADQELHRHVRSLGVQFRRALCRGDEGWEEPGFLLLGEVRPLLVELGLVFGQNAVVWIDASGDVSLVCTRAGFAGRRPGQRID